MPAVKQVMPQAFQDPEILRQLLAQAEPFVVRQAAAVPPELYQQMLRQFQSHQLTLFNVSHSKASGGIENFHSLFEAIERLRAGSASGADPQALWQEYQATVGKYLLPSQSLNTQQHFSVQLDIQAGSALSRRLIEPITTAYARCLHPITRRLYLNTVVNISRGHSELAYRSRNLHAHNYDTFTTFVSAGPETAVYLFTPSFYRQFRARAVPTQPGILLFFPEREAVSDPLFEQALVHVNVQPGDIIYTPPMWFHCFHHQGEYMNIANGEFLPDWLPARLPAVNAETFGADAALIAQHMRSLQQFALRGGPKNL
ncbi:MAG: hypothetical protein IGS03_11640 [Candidatus Sericytochromatia bacterium]|nr:hypothetical protein [Candidatus Sericytochromatia bacterium]